MRQVYIYVYVYRIDSPPPVARSYNSILDPAVFMLSAAFTDPCRIKKGNSNREHDYNPDIMVVTLKYYPFTQLDAVN